MSEEEKKNEEGDEKLFIHKEITVDPKQSQLRIDKYLMDRLEKASRNRIQNGLRAGSILVNEKTVKPNYKVRPLDQIKIVLPEEPRLGFEVKGEDIPLDIIFEDAFVMVVNKPAGMVVHPGVGNYTGTLVNAVKFHSDNNDLPLLKGNSLDRPGLVHRIDKDTSGLLVLAKTEYAMTHLAKQFFDHSIDREYEAIIWGSFDEKEGTIDEFIGRDKYVRTKMAVYPERDEGKEAITHYKVIQDLYYVSHIMCKLETGRTHQIRVHLKHQHKPIFNDKKYGGDSIVKGTVFSKYKQFVQNTFKVIERQALHAKTIGFIHPETKEYMKFEQEMPEDMRAALERWKNYLDGRKINQI